MKQYPELEQGQEWLVQGAPNVPNLGWFPTTSISYLLEKLLPGMSVHVIISFFQEKGDASNWLLDKTQMEKVGKQLEKDPAPLCKMWNTWEENVIPFYTFIEELETNGIQNWVAQYEQFIDLYRTEYTPALITEHFVVWSDRMMERITRGMTPEQKDAVQLVTLPYRRPFTGDEELGALGITTQLFQEKDVSAALQEYQSKFYWVESGYKYTRALTSDDFLQRIQDDMQHTDRQLVRNRIAELENYDQRRKDEQRSALASLAIPSEDKDALVLLSKISWLHDQRKKGNLLGSFWANKFIELASTTLQTPFEALQFTTPPELLAWMKNGIEVSPALLQERMKGAVLINDSTGTDDLLHGEEFQQMKEAYLDTDVQDLSDLRGVTASRGNATGPVRIITVPSKQEIKEGEVLVAPMTRPDYVPHMKKAAAIVTDEGGVTSHAAVISRELGIPCIVGTKVATQVLRDSTLVEIRGNHGLVKVL